MTQFRKYEIAIALKQQENILKDKFEEEFNSKSSEIDTILMFLSMDTDEMKKQMDIENMPK